MLLVLRNAASVSSFLTSIRMGPFPASRSTLPGFSAAPVSETSKERTVTPVGGASVIDTVTCADCGSGGGGLTVDDRPQPPIEASATIKTGARKDERCILRLLSHLCHGGRLWT